MRRILPLCCSFALALAGAACGPGTPAGGVDGGADGAGDGSLPPADANPDTTPPPCSHGYYDAGLPLPTHGAIVAYDKFLYYDPVTPDEAPAWVFVDSDGVATFTLRGLVRASLDGDLVRVVPYPDNPNSTRSIGVGSIAQGPDRYGMVYHRCSVSAAAATGFSVAGVAA
jgi:hypothetical protein